jgi:hypothetical protein
MSVEGANAIGQPAPTATHFGYASPICDDSSAPQRAFYIIGGARRRPFKGRRLFDINNLR